MTAPHADVDRSSVDANSIDVLRRFNRSHTRRVGVLDESFLGTGRPLGPVRLLFEIGPDGAPIAELRARLGLDSGYLSRLVRELEGDELITLATDPTDRRRRTASLTPTGLAAWDDLDRRSDALATDLLAPLTARQRGRLTEALAIADRLLRAATVEFIVVDPESTEAVAALTAYFAELDERFRGGFDPADTLTADAPALRPPTGSFVVAVVDVDVVACGGVQRHDPTSGEIKRMWVHPDWRGAGVGRRMLDRLEQEVSALGHRRVVLDTNDTLTEAIAMYQRAGYRAIERYNDNPYAKCWFAKELT